MTLDKHTPPAAYPVALMRGRIQVPDFQTYIPGDDLLIAEAWIKKDLRNRRLNDHYFPFASSVRSVEDKHPEATVLMISTEGWENPGPLIEPPEGEE